MESDICYRCAASQRHVERLDGAIEILVMDGVFIMPHAIHRPADFVDNECSPIHAGFWFDRYTCCSRPSIRRGGHSHRRANTGEGEVCRPSHIETPIGGVVIHVALPSVRLTPGILVRAVILSFSVV